MRKFLVAAAAATTALAAAAPAAAQYYPAPVNPYQQPYYGQGYGYAHNNYGLIRSYQHRVDRLQRAIQRMDSRDRISEREARRLRAGAIDLQNRTRAYAQNGLSSRERYELDQRFASLQQALRRDARDGRGQWGNGQYRDRDRDGQWDRNDQWIDRDRDGRDDRYEDDRGRYPG